MVVTLVMVALFGKWWMWWGGFAWGPASSCRWRRSWCSCSHLGWSSARRAVCSVWPVVRRVLLIVVLAFSFIVQVLAVTANYVNYEIALRGLYPTDGRYRLVWSPAMFNPADSPVLGQARLLLENLDANLDLGWVWAGHVAWQVPAGWWHRPVRRTHVVDGWAGAAGDGSAAPAAVVLAVAGLLVLGVLSARTYAARPEYGTTGQGYAAALAEIEAAEGQQPVRRGDGIITIAPYHYQVPMAQYRGRLPIYGYATESLPLHSETESVLWRAVRLHGRLAATVGLPPADPTNGVEAWLAW